jgi:hypothetical protein
MPRRETASRDEKLDVYALAAGPVPQRVRVGRASLRVIFVGPVAAIAGPPLSAPTVEDALRQQHAIVLALADRFDPLLPARFGSRMTHARIDAAIRGSADVVMRALNHVRGRRQMTVRLIGPERPERSEKPPATGTSYLAARRAAHAVPAEGAPLQQAVAPFVVDERIQPGRGGVRSTLFHLVSRDDVERYERAVEASAPHLSPWRAVVSGPWPPFAFAPELVA